ncbi:hypothetical protein BGZ63DRAFT_506852 [Mariannaea sp. PMI_226]|nr:hypothetical protein BGZ63DRAFT_506852 [Mariannaea sp. PMI_226]
MSPLSVMVFIAQDGAPLRRAYSQHYLDDATYLQLFFRILVGQVKCASKLSAALEEGLPLVWEDAYDFVNPYGDRRGGIFGSVWTFDLDKDVILLTKEHQYCSAPLELARERLLTLDDFQPLSPPVLEEPTLPGPYWDPNLDLPPRVRSFQGKVLRDFAYAWRHVLRRQMNDTTFRKLAYATIWISGLQFALQERAGFEHVSRGGPYVHIANLPSWEAPKATFIQTGSSWFVLAQDTKKGLEMMQCHMNSLPLGESAGNGHVYVILSHRYVTLCKANGHEVVWTRPEPLFGDIPISDAAIDMILWANNTASTKSQPSAINFLPIEIQDRILYYATTSLVASAKLGCELGLGSPFSWTDRGVKIQVEVSKRHRSEFSPIESHISFDKVLSGLSYKRERGYNIIHVRPPPVPAPRRK